MLHAETLDPLADARWQRFVECSANGGIFHHTEWLRLLHAQYGYPMLARCVSDDEGELLAGLPFARVRSRLTGTRLVAVPFSDVCAPVQRDLADTATLARLLDVVCAERERDGVDVEIRAALDGVGRGGEGSHGGDDSHRGEGPHGGAGARDDAGTHGGASFHRSGGGFYQHELALGPDLAAIQSGFTKMVSRGITRARRDGVEVVHATTAEALAAFYRLHLHTRRRQGVPTQPKRFIERFARLFEEGLGFTLLARAGGRPIAAAVFLEFNGVLTYKYGASDSAQLKLRPNNAIFMEAIRWGCEHGLHTLDMGRTDHDNEGLRAFKLGWGTRERELTYTRLCERSAGAARSGVPRPLASLISRTPPLTGRLVGAALYRHFG